MVFKVTSSPNVGSEFDRARELSAVGDRMPDDQLAAIRTLGKVMSGEISADDVDPDLLHTLADTLGADKVESMFLEARAQAEKPDTPRQ